VQPDLLDANGTRSGQFQGGEGLCEGLDRFGNVRGEEIVALAEELDETDAQIGPEGFGEVEGAAEVEEGGSLTRAPARRDSTRRKVW